MGALQASGMLKRSNEEDTYICAFEVKSPHRVCNLKGLMLPESQRLFADNVPVNNPWLRLMSEKSN